MPTAQRVTVYQDHAGEWRYPVQGQTLPPEDL